MSDDPFDLFGQWYAEARETEPNDSNAMTLATAGADGQPAARMVLLKGHGPDGFIFYTNQESRKALDIAANPKAAILFHWKSLRRQIRIEGSLSGVPDETADGYFASRSRDSQLGAWASDQSRPLADRETFEARYDEMKARFEGQGRDPPAALVGLLPDAALFRVLAGRCPPPASPPNFYHDGEWMDRKITLPMTKLPYYHVDAFADRPFTGNQAAVMPLTEWLSDETLQAIGEENNFAETAFYVPDETDEADFELRWFTPTVEIRLCGHATLASGHIILSQNPDKECVTFRTRKAGVLVVTRDGDGYALALPAYPPAPKQRPEIVELVGGNPIELQFHAGRYNVIRYESADDVLALTPDLKALGALGNEQFICTAPGADTDVLSRVFVPGGGVDEDSVTGSAHAVLTPYWAEQLGRGSFTAYQASLRGGYVNCTLDGDRAILGGKCVTVVEGSFLL